MSDSFRDLNGFDTATNAVPEHVLAEWRRQFSAGHSRVGDNEHGNKKKEETPLVFLNPAGIQWPEVTAPNCETQFWGYCMLTNMANGPALVPVEKENGTVEYEYVYTQNDGAVS